MRTGGPCRQAMHAQLAAGRQHVAAGALDHGCGAALGALIWAQRSSVAAGGAASGRAGAAWLLHHVNWLRGTPAGIKMHAELSASLAGWILAWLRAAAGTADMALPTARLEAAVAVLAVIGAVFGLSALLAVAHDLALLCLSPVMLVAWSLGAMYQWQLACLGWAWRLIHTPRPSYSSGMAAPGGGPQEGASDPAPRLVVERLIVGVLLFIPLLLLLPTTAAYTMFFGCIAAASLALSCCLSILADLTASGWPIVPAVIRLCNKELLASGVYLEPYRAWALAVAAGHGLDSDNSGVLRLRNSYRGWAEVLLPALDAAVRHSSVCLLPVEVLAWAGGRRRPCTWLDRAAASFWHRLQLPDTDAAGRKKSE
mmetsp:Transcript_10650/g.27072  ORF Transcript_10650/g.27072 Transcript_10650/m.27072 type:complete len:369 (-) Transcript_10650:379-1485(-)